MSHFDNPVLDGITPSWADIFVRVSPLGGSLLEIGDIAAISGASKVEVGMQKEGGRGIKRTSGDLTHEAKWTLYTSGYLKLIRGLVARAQALGFTRGNQVLISLVHFTVNVQWSVPGGAEIFERRYKGCRVLSDSQDSAEGTDAEQIEMDLSPLEIVRVIDGVEVALL